MHGYIRQNTATDRPFGPFVEASDGSSYKATTITMPTTGTQHVRVWKTDGTVTGLADAITLFEPGWARLSIAASDVTSVGVVRYAIGNATNNMPVWREYMVVPANVYDSMILGSDFLQVDVVQVTGAAPSSAAIGSVANLTTGVNVTSVNAGVVGVNVTSINGSAVSNATVAAGSFLDYVMFTPGVQSITVKDTLKVMAAALAGRCTGATGAAMVFHGPSGESRVSAALASGNRTGTTWVTG